MGSTIFGGILLLIGLIAVLAAVRAGASAKSASGSSASDARTARNIGAGVAAIFLIAAAVVLFIASFYTNQVNQAKVFVSFDGKVQGVKVEPGAGLHAPWTRVIEFDLASQKLSFAGDGKGTPSYTGGEVNGQQITAAVKGGTQSNYDLQLTYNIDASRVESIYKDYRSQENFSSQVIVPTVLSAARKVPNQYDAIAFRGDKQGEAQEAIIENTNAALKPFGVKVTVGALQNINYPEDVENSIKAVQVAQQKQEQAEAELKATEVSAQQKVVEAKAEAEANDTLAKSLTPEVLQSKQLDTLEKLGQKGNTFVVPNGSNPLIQVQK